MRPLSLFAVLGLAGACVLSCSHGETAQKGSQSTMLRGDRASAPSLRASRDRPVSWEKDEGPLGTNRLGLDELAHRRHAEHLEEHSRHDLEMEGFSHPACVGLTVTQKRTCPLVRPHWTEISDVPGGIRLTTMAGGDQLRTHRMRLLCHAAFGRARPRARACPLHHPTVRSRLVSREKGLQLTITTTTKEQVDLLRSAIRQLLD